MSLLYRKHPRPWISSCHRLKVSKGSWPPKGSQCFQTRPSVSSCLASVCSNTQDLSWTKGGHKMCNESRHRKPTYNILLASKCPIHPERQEREAPARRRHAFQSRMDNCYREMSHSKLCKLRIASEPNSFHRTAIRGFSRESNLPMIQGGPSDQRKSRVSSVLVRMVCILGISERINRRPESAFNWLQRCLARLDSKSFNAASAMFVDNITNEPRRAHLSSMPKRAFVHHMTATGMREKILVHKKASHTLRYSSSQYLNKTMGKSDQNAKVSSSGSSLRNAFPAMTRITNSNNMLTGT